MINKPVHFGKTLEHFLKENHIRVADFADMIGCKRNYIYALYKKELFSMEVTLQICELFKLPITYFVKVKGTTVDTLNVRKGHIAEDIKSLTELKIVKEENKELQKENKALNKEVKELLAANGELKSKIIDMLEGKTATSK